jgi:DNA-binding transcriptional regulator YiaG
MPKYSNHPKLHLGVSVFAAAFFSFALWYYNTGMLFYLYPVMVILYSVFTMKFHLIDVTVIFFALLLVSGLYNRIEGFESKKKSKSKAAKKEHMENDDGEESDHDEEDHEEHEKKEKETMENEDSSSSSDASKDPHMDLGSTWLKAYSKLSPDAVKSMREDTKELMQTQKELMGTLNTLGPSVKEGLAMLDSFKKYFGGNGMPQVNPAEISQSLPGMQQ